jgi:hypothetical protein
VPPVVDGLPAASRPRCDLGRRQCPDQFVLHLGPGPARLGRSGSPLAVCLAHPGPRLGAMERPPVGLSYGPADMGRTGLALAGRADLGSPFRVACLGGRLGHALQLARLDALLVPQPAGARRRGQGMRPPDWSHRMTGPWASQVTRWPGRKRGVLYLPSGGSGWRHPSVTASDRNRVQGRRPSCRRGTKAPGGWVGRPAGVPVEDHLAKDPPRGNVARFDDRAEEPLPAGTPAPLQDPHVLVRSPGAPPRRYAFLGHCEWATTTSDVNGVVIGDRSCVLIQAPGPADGPQLRFHSYSPFTLSRIPLAARLVPQPGG